MKTLVLKLMIMQTFLQETDDLTRTGRILTTGDEGTEMDLLIQLTVLKHFYKQH